MMDSSSSVRSRRAALHELLGLAGLASLAGAGGWVAGAAHAQPAFPNRPIRIVVPWAPGGLVDTGGRLLAEGLAKALPSLNSRDHGRCFADLFAAAGHDFYKLDGALFAPAEVWVSHLGSGRTWHAGRLEMDLLRQQWLAEAA